MGFIGVTHSYSSCCSYALLLMVNHTSIYICAHLYSKQSHSQNENEKKKNVAVMSVVDEHKQTSNPVTVNCSIVFSTNLPLDFF